MNVDGEKAGRMFCLLPLLIEFLSMVLNVITELLFQLSALSFLESMFLFTLKVKPKQADEFSVLLLASVQLFLLFASTFFFFSLFGARMEIPCSG